jgi:redox-sensitive bicupin YhaK (pirin superfamily)
MMYADIILAPGARFQIVAEHEERAIYMVSGAVEVAGQVGDFAAAQLVVFKPGAEIILKAREPARLMLLGGEPLPEERHIQWNFVSSSPARGFRALAPIDRFTERHRVAIIIGTLVVVLGGCTKILVRTN